MQDENLDLNLDELDQIEANSEKTLQVKNRFQQLANDKRTLAQQKEQTEAKLKEEAEARSKAEKSLEFYRTFSQISAKQPEATNYQEQILEKVNTGLSVEDATLLVLAKEGKLGPPQGQVQSQTRTEDVAGGSAINHMPEGDRTPSEMSINEKEAQLREMEKSGELIQVLRAGINRS